jgi:ABC-type glycerol-3-phosphate transport system substrate-binding protein
LLRRNGRAQSALPENPVAKERLGSKIKRKIPTRYWAQCRIERALTPAPADRRAADRGVAMTKAVHALSGGSRRQFLKATAIGAAGAALGIRPGVGAPKTMSIMHENSFIKTFDEYFQKTLIPAYEKLTGVKIKYELVSVGGLQTRVTTVAETGTGPDMTLNFFNWPFLYDEKYVDVTDIAEEAGKKNGGWHDAAKEAVVVNGKWKAIPFGNVGQLMNWRTDWFKEAGHVEHYVAGLTAGAVK